MTALAVVFIAVAFLLAIALFFVARLNGQLSTENGVLFDDRSDLIDQHEELIDQLLAKKARAARRPVK